ncbi:hypothetical protein DWV13_05590 [Clostridium botulinum]|uniref:hypothetical protein n=1 Tax=Clostridium TaxID=1485 RepID=UPI0013F6B3E8|nr:MULTISPECIES: hypothetical protein [Clostridium]MCS6131118.1 hypothetical protein [Clostridium botulinum]NFL44026.1 hypothetical protein [Clostridium botulinum]
MLFWFDRLQYREADNKLIIFEFFETELLNINSINKNNWNENLAKNIFDEFTFRKHIMIRNLMHLNYNICYYLIIYSNKDEQEKKVLEYVNDRTLNIKTYDNFFKLREWFLAVNGENSTSYSKPLGGLESGTDYGKELILKFWGSGIRKDDDQGRKYTEKLLTKYGKSGEPILNNEGEIMKYNTYGFDFDLFIFLEQEPFLLNIELAYNEKLFIPNVKCSPMRYCWNGSSKDNKRKYNQLWKATQMLNGKFSILNYTDKNNMQKREDNVFGFSIINDLDEERGFLNETKFRITKDNFEQALEKIIRNSDIELKEFKKKSESFKIYNEEFFRNWQKNKNKYK